MCISLTTHKIIHENLDILTFRFLFYEMPADVICHFYCFILIVGTHYIFSKLFVKDTTHVLYQSIAWGLIVFVLLCLWVSFLVFFHRLFSYSFLQLMYFKKFLYFQLFVIFVSCLRNSSLALTS